jgi:mRNA-degrading endonuclease RelE of RelBE toxin-antitoxin system
VPRLTKRAAKDLEDLGRLSDKARTLIRRLDEEPALGKKLVGGLKGKRSARLGRSHRVIYEATDSGVVVLAIRPRKDAYR